MTGLNELERAVLDKMLAGDHPVLAILRQQADVARLSKRVSTGVGFVCEFEVDRSAPITGGDFHIGDVDATVTGLAHGAGFVLFVVKGRICRLEGYTYDEPWPEQIERFSLKYSDPQRRKQLAKLG
jgi:hypothetical protein